MILHYLATGLSLVTISLGSLVLVDTVTAYAPRIWSALNGRGA